jgi:DNA invertase Pin-like site-specific DNA recombinase
MTEFAPNPRLVHDAISRLLSLHQKVMMVNMSKTIYSRVSTDGQDNRNQLAALRVKHPDAVVFEETAGGTKQRPVLTALIKNHLKSGDTLVVAELSRLGRRMSEVVRTIEDLYARGITVVSERESTNYSTPQGRLMTQVLASVAELEREMLRQRTIEALAAKRAQGIVGGRRPSFSAETVEKVKQLRAEGKTLRDISLQTGMSTSRIYQLTNPTWSRRKAKAPAT